MQPFKFEVLQPTIYSGGGVEWTILVDQRYYRIVHYWSDRHWYVDTLPEDEPWSTEHKEIPLSWCWI